MKKLILSALVAISAITANAQVWVGGEVGFNSSSTDAGMGSVTTKNFVIAPEVGYKVNENVDVAIALGYAHAEDAQKVLNVDLGQEVGKANAFAVNPYVRYSFAKTGNLSFFVDGGLTFATVDVDGFDKNMTVFGVGIKPGLAYGLSDKVSLVAHVGDLSFAHGKWGEVKSDNFNIGLTNAISFGVYFSF